MKDIIKLSWKNLMLNKNRTITTLVMIIITVATFAGISIMYESAIKGLEQTFKETKGDYHIAVKNVDKDYDKDLLKADNVKEVNEYYTISKGVSRKGIEKDITKEKGKEYLPNELLGKQKFKTTWCRLKWNYPSPTIDTRFDTPSNGTNSHPKLNRAITPREAARIQSFPDRFHFLGNKTSICKQIGNAVPPLLAKEIGQSILNQLNKIDNFSDSEITIYNRDAYELVTELKSKNFHFDHLITDPPYNISQKNNFSTMRSAKRNGIDFGEWDKNFDLFSWIKPYIELLNKNGSVIIFCSFRYLSYIVSILEENDMKVKDVMIWTKSNPMPRNTTRRYVQDTEYAVWAVKNKSKWVFNKPNGIPYLRAKFVTSIVSGKEKSIHPTQKSLKLMKEIINIHTNENDLIIDPFMGSGTTGVAAKELKRKFLGIEKEKKYFDIAKERLNFNKITKDNN